MNSPQDALARPSLLRCLWLPFGVISGLVIAGVGYQYLPNYDPVRAAAWNKVEHHVRRLNEETRQEAEASTRLVREFLEQRKKNARAFAEDVLSYSGKWAFVKDQFIEGSHKKYLEERFEQRILSSGDLRSLLESVITQYVSEVEGRENQLIVKIRADLEGDSITAPAYLPTLRDGAAFRKEFDAMLQKVAIVGQGDVGVMAGRMVASEIVGFMIMKLATSLAAELGISGGILGSGALGTAGSAGLTLAIGFLADYVIDWGLRQAGYDPEAEIAAKVVEALDRLEDLLLNGSPATRKQYNDASFYSFFSWSSSDRDASWGQARAIKSSGGLGLIGQLQDLDEKRSNARYETLRNLILIGGEK